MKFAIAISAAYFYLRVFVVSNTHSPGFYVYIHLYLQVYASINSL